MLAPNKPKKHALILRGIGVILGLVSVIAIWNMALGPRRYPILLVVLALPQCWAGAKLSRAEDRQPLKPATP